MIREARPKEEKAPVAGLGEGAEGYATHLEGGQFRMLAGRDYEVTTSSLDGQKSNNELAGRISPLCNAPVGNVGTHTHAWRPNRTSRRPQLVLR